MPSVMQARREAVSDARKKSAELLVAAGQSATPQMMQRVSSTLEALATYGNAPDRGVAGRLTEELAAPGFDELAALGILHGAAGSKPRADREIAEAKRKEAERAHASLLEAQGQAEVLRRKRQELEKALAEAERQERTHAPALAEARQAVRTAQRAARPAASVEARLGRRPGRRGS